MSPFSDSQFIPSFLPGLLGVIAKASLGVGLSCPNIFGGRSVVPFPDILDLRGVLTCRDNNCLVCLENVSREPVSSLLISDLYQDGLISVGCTPNEGAAVSTAGLSEITLACILLKVSCTTVVVSGISSQLNFVWLSINIWDGGYYWRAKSCTCLTIHR